MNSTRCIALLATSSLVLMASLASVSVSSATPFSVYWTAPGDDGLIGQASAYDLRYSSLPITGANFNQATLILGLPFPGLPGTPESFVVSGLSDAQSYYLAIKSRDESGNWSALSNVMTRPGQTTDVDQSGLALEFSSPWPNPARTSVQWAYSVPQATQVQVEVFDLSGRHVRTVASGERGAGRGELSWDLRDDRGLRIDAGVYFVKARLGSMVWTKRLIVLS